jgi:hypothetical protein
MTTIRPSPVLAAVAAILTLAFVTTPSHAQLGGLIKKKAGEVAGQTAAKKLPATPPAFDDVTLELTDEVLAQVIAGKKAGNAFKRGPNGPAAVRTRWEAAEERWSDLYNKNAKVLDAWSEKRQGIENCRDSALVAAHDRRREEFRRRLMAQDPVLIRKMLAIAQAQASGDSATAERLNREAQALEAPTAADSSEATKVCGDPNTGPAVAAQVQKLYDEKEALKKEMQEAENEIGRLEQAASHMDDKQLAVACERIKEYLNNLKAKLAGGNFSEEELAALEKRIKDLEDLCD